MAEIAPSILAADFTRLGEEIAAVEAAGASYIHVDVMDGHFVPNLTLGPFIVKWVRKATRLPIDVHLMIERPDQLIKDFARAGANLISVHPEATYHLHRTLDLIRSTGCRPGIVLNPGTPVSIVEEVVESIDYVLVMSVNPGFGGQEFISSSFNKLRRVRASLGEHQARVRVEIDGGIAPSNAADVVAAGADILVAGSAIFGEPDPAAAVRALSRAANQASHA